MVGTILKELIAGLNIEPKDGCNCEELRDVMDRLGPEQCKLDREWLVSLLRENASKMKWTAKVSAICPAIASGLAFKVNPLDPIPGLFDEAVRIAESRQNADVIEHVV